MKDENNFELSVIADRFVYGMIRALVGTMIDIARNKKSIKSITEALENQDRTLCSSLAPAFGLDLYRIYYKPPFDCLNECCM